MQPDNAQHGEQWRLCFSLLPKVSRTFALSIAQLKSPMRHSVCLAYLLCRLLDTFEDAADLPTPRKSTYINDLQAFVAGTARPDPAWGRRAAAELAGRADGADLELLECLDSVLAALDSLPMRDRQAIDRCFQEMATGMIEMQVLLDQSLAGSVPARLRVLPRMDSLERYCHFVAGIVGGLLTELLQLNSDALDPERHRALLSRSEAFGQYLQKINILKDIPGDHAAGWCFIPRSAIAAQGIAPEDLLNAPPELRVGAIAPVILDVLGHVAVAWQYLALIPLPEREYRLFLAYSFFFGVKTLELGLREPDRSFEAKRPLKIGRLDVAAILARVNLLIDDPRGLEAYLRAILDAARRGLDPRWPASVPAALENVLGSLVPAGVEA